MNEQEINIELIRKGIRFSDIDKKYNFPRGTARLAVNMPSKKGEAALSEILGIPAYKIWPNRYDKDGKRLKPQPTHYYISQRDTFSLKKTRRCPLKANLDNAGDAFNKIEKTEAL